MDEEECGLAAVIEEEEPQSADEVGATQVKACSSIRYSTTVHSFSEHFPKYRPENTSANCAAFQSTSTHSRTSVVADVAMVAAAKPLSTSSATVRRTARILYSCAIPFSRLFFPFPRSVHLGKIFACWRCVRSSGRTFTEHLALESLVCTHLECRLYSCGY